MFTLLPSLYLVAVHYIRRWHSPYYYEENNAEEEKKIFDTKPSNDKQLIENIDDTLQSNDQSLISHHQQLSRSNSLDKNGYLSKVTNDEDDQCKVKLRAKKSNRSSSLLNTDRRKTYTGDLTEDDIVYLMNETGFNREQILLWHSDFLVCN
jgi:hypothetical protein